MVLWHEILSFQYVTFEIWKWIIWDFICTLNNNIFKLNLVYIYIYIYIYIYTARFALLICYGFNSLSTIICYGFNSVAYLWMFLMVFYGKCKWTLVVFWAHLVKAIWQTFRSQFHIFVGYLGINSFAEEVLKSFSGRRNVLEQPVFGFTNSLLYSLEEESRKLRVLISWVLILLSKLIALWRCSYEVPKTIFILYWIHL